MAKYYHFNTIDSTSSYLKENYSKYDNLTFVSADYQEKGHGRNNRKWISEYKENLLFSILIKDKDLINKYDWLSLSSAACIYEILIELNLKNVLIKWPNDIFINDKKVAGILLESISFGKGIEALVLGIGINVNSINFPNNMINNPTSICLELGEDISLEDFKELVYSKFIEMLDRIKNNDKSYLKILQNNNYLKGKSVYANIENKKVLVEVIDINEDNSLKVKIGKQYINIYSGEISFHV